MPEGVGYGPQNTASTGLDLNVVGNHAYAHSGIQSIGSAGVGSESDLLNFRTGNFILVVTFQFHYGTVSTEDYRYRIYLNNTTVVEYVAGDRVGEQPDNVIPLIIPPYTQVKAGAANMSANNDQDQSCTVSGRLYKEDK